MIDAAFARHGTPEIVNTDQGSQFTAETFTEAVLAQGCKLSMDGRGAWRSVKYERVYLKAYDSVSADIAEYLHWYNTGRSHSSLSDVTPEQAHLDWLPKLAEAA